MRNQQEQQKQRQSFEPGLFLPGGHNTDPPLPESSPTTGYKLNHFMLRIRDPSRSLHFYTTLLGMRTVFTMNAGPFTLYYLGYPPTPSDRADLPAWAARTSEFHTLTQTPGLLELYHVHGSEKSVEDGGVEISNGNTPPHLGFGHLGVTVPDVAGAVERLRSHGVRVVKEVGGSERADVPLSEWEESRGVGVGEMHANYKAFFDRFAFVADPVSFSFGLSWGFFYYACVLIIEQDGYLVEILPQSMG